MLVMATGPSGSLCARQLSAGVKGREGNRWLEGAWQGAYACIRDVHFELCLGVFL